MEKNILQYSLEPSASNQGNDVSYESSHMNQQVNLFIALGLQEQDPGYSIVTDSLKELGPCTALHESLWLVSTTDSLDLAFKKINTSMMDRRIGSGSGLFVMNANHGNAKWYFSYGISQILRTCWANRNSFFVAINLRDPHLNYNAIHDDIRALGTWTPISKTLWYVNSAYSSKEAFQLLMGRMERGDQLCVLDSNGNVATWQDRSGEITWAPQAKEQHPKMARIHLKEANEIAISRAA